MSNIDFTARCMAAEATHQINKASTGFTDLDVRLDTMDIAIETNKKVILSNQKGGVICASGC